MRRTGAYSPSNSFGKGKLTFSATPSRVSMAPRTQGLQAIHDAIDQYLGCRGACSHTDSLLSAGIDLLGAMDG